MSPHTDDVDRLRRNIPLAVTAIIAVVILLEVDSSRYRRHRSAIRQSVRSDGNGGAAGDYELFTPLRSSWTKTLPPQCARIVQRVEFCEQSQRAPLEAIMLGHRKNPGKNGLGDRMKGLLGASVVALRLCRPFRMSLKADVFDPKLAVSFVYDWNRPWQHFFDLKKKGLRTYTRFSKVNIASLSEQNETVLLAMDGGYFAQWDVVGDDLIAGLTRGVRGLQKGKDAQRALVLMCMGRALLRPSQPVLNSISNLLRGASNSAVTSATREPLLLGLHARYAGKFEKNARTRMTPAQVTAQVWCAWNMSMSWNNEVNRGGKPNSVFWLIASDKPDKLIQVINAFLILRAKENTSLNVTVIRNTEGTVKHVKASVAREVISRLWADWFLLSEATTCCYGPSGFPQSACTMSLRVALNHGRNEANVGHCNTWREEL
eukprot:m.35003 g.35003  ORF g.35003 m.35003 type:complete len:431 (-) comp7397_c0_seq2:2669-3961(-)